MTVKTLAEIHYDAVHLSALLKTLLVALPDDAIGCKTDTRFVVGWAYRLAEQLAEGIDAFDLSRSTAKVSAVGGTHE